MSSLERALSLEGSPAMRALKVSTEIKTSRVEDLSRTETIVLLVGGNGGSFSEQAAEQYALTRYAERAEADVGTPLPPLDVLIIYLIDAGGVLDTLNLFRQEGEMKNVFGIFAHHNNHGGVPREYQDAIGRGQYVTDKDPEGHVRLVELQVKHMLMGLKMDGKLRAVVTQGQAYEQCQAYVESLKELYPGLIVINDYKDTATAAKHLADGTLVGELSERHPEMRGISPDEVAVIGPENSGTLYGLAIREREVQDNEDNITRFLVVRPLDAVDK
jgi:hypothetical protein